MISDYPLLDRQNASPLISYIKGQAVSYVLASMAEDGKLPFTPAWQSNKNKSHRHLELCDENNNAKITISQVNKPTSLPRGSRYRQSLSVDNGQMRMPGFEVSSDNISCHAIILHGYQSVEPNFVAIGIPSSDNKCWLERRTLPKMIIVENKQEYEDTNYETLIGAIIEDTIRSEKDNGN